MIIGIRDRLGFDDTADLFNRVFYGALCFVEFQSLYGHPAGIDQFLVRLRRFYRLRLLRFFFASRTCISCFFAVIRFRLRHRCSISVPVFIIFDGSRCLLCRIIIFTRGGAFCTSAGRDHKNKNNETSEYSCNSFELLHNECSFRCKSCLPYAIYTGQPARMLHPKRYFLE